MVFKVKSSMRIFLSAILTEFYSLRNVMKANFRKKALFLAFLLREPHGKENLAFLVKVGNKRKN